MLELREFCESLCTKEFQQIKDLLPSAAEWDSIGSITHTLSHFARLTTLMQREVSSLSDFFGGWAKIKMELHKIRDDQLGQQLLTDMKSREDVLFNNQVLNAAVFLDPRFQNYMPFQNKEKAIDFLCKLHKKMETCSVLNRNDMEQINVVDDELDEFMRCSMYSNENETGAVNEEIEISADLPVEDIKTILKKFIGIKEPRTTPVFEYWARNKEAKPELFRLASIVHCVPPTQTSVERAFSAMALLLSPLRTRLSNEILEKMLIIRLNRDDFKNIKNFDL